ncbi:hypothetical protein RSOLAG22IIIB_03518 [Rhizoctonia solani]|uniref:FAS1 domain-containing protein n=1 Tax=Rhizoctonia solani TaxID=456999 RepID=A0A0K6FQH0_9AGAM|nr:hypothetical protein RSOLAG22IIIB_03518 [Rhizoctonia solani]
MHIYALLAALTAPALAQNVNSTYINGLNNVLNGLGLTALVAVVNMVANDTNGGTALISQLSQGNKTAFAPTNEAFSRAGLNPNNNAGLLVPHTSYHIVDGHYNTSDFAQQPNHTIIRTYLTNSSLVDLEGGKGQVLVLERDGNNARVLPVNGTINIGRTATYENLIIHTIDQTFIPPGNISETAAAANLSAIAGALQTANLLAPLEAAHGITIFAPTNQAFNAALAALGSQAQNASVVSSILANHVINGTSVYSTGLTSQSFASAGGQPFSFSTNSSGTYVTSGSSSARITRADIPTLLANTASNPEAAASAAASQSSVAATATSVPGPTSAGGSTSSSNASIRTATTLPGTAALFSVVAAGMSAFLGGMLVL